MSFGTFDFVKVSLFYHKLSLIVNVVMVSIIVKIIIVNSACTSTQELNLLSISVKFCLCYLCHKASWGSAVR